MDGSTDVVRREEVGYFGARPRVSARRPRAISRTTPSSDSAMARPLSLPDAHDGPLARIKGVQHPLPALVVVPGATDVPAGRRSVVQGVPDGFEVGHEGLALEPVTGRATRTAAWISLLHWMPCREHIVRRVRGC